MKPERPPFQSSFPFQYTNWPRMSYQANEVPLKLLETALEPRRDDTLALADMRAKIRQAHGL